MIEKLNKNIEELVQTEGPAIPGAELLSNNDEALKLIGGTAIPGHEGIRGRIVGVQEHPDEGTLVAVTWRSEYDGKSTDAVKGFKLDELLAYNQEIEQNFSENVEVLGKAALDEVMIDSEQAKEAGAESSKSKNELIGVTHDFLMRSLRFSEYDAPNEEKDQHLVRDYAAFRDSLPQGSEAENLLAAAVMVGGVKSEEYINNTRNIFRDSLDMYMDSEVMTNEEIQRINNLLSDYHAVSSIRLDSMGLDSGASEEFIYSRMMQYSEELNRDANTPTVKKVIGAMLLSTGVMSGEQGKHYLHRNSIDILEKVFQQ